MTNYYYEFIAETPYCGTEVYHYEVFDHEPTDEELEEMADDFARDNGESFEYLITGWDGEDPTEEELAYYWEECCCYYRAITKEEYKENVGL